MAGGWRFVLAFWLFFLAPGIFLEAAQQTPAFAKMLGFESAEPSRPPGAPPTPGVKTASQPGPPNGVFSVSETKKLAPPKSPSLLQLLEGHESELMIAVAIAAGFFVIGWVCGGNYYLRRDRLRRRKIRL